MEVGWSHRERKKQRGDLTTVIHHLWGVGEKVEPDSSWRHIARGNRRKLQRGKFWLERKKNIHRGDGEALELVPGEAMGSLLWEVFIAQLDQPSATCSSFAGQPGSKQGLARRPWTRSLLPKAAL